MTFYDYCKENNKESFLTFWSDENKISPQDITHCSRQKVIFKCPVCGWQVEKIIHDIRKNQGIACNECKKKEKEKILQENKIKKENKPKKESNNSILRDYIPLDKINYKTKEFHCVVQISEKRIYRKKNGEISSIKLFCKDDFGETDFLIRFNEECFEDFEKGLLVDIKGVKEGFCPIETKILSINRITERQYNQIQEAILKIKIENKNRKNKAKEQNAFKKQKELELLNKLPIEKRYLMIDIETNGLNSKGDDLLEIAIYRPDTNTMFHKYLPLTKQKKVFTTEHNGITKEKLKGARHLTEKDIEVLIADFEIDKRILLHYGDLDAPFVKNYFQEHKLPKRSLLKFQNFKNQIISSRFVGNDIAGGISKDNLCELYNIDGVLEIHDCQNDCLLQWKLFLKMYNKRFIVTDNKLFSIPEDSKYLVPSSFLNYSRIQNILKSPLPNIVIDEHIVYNKKEKSYVRISLGDCLPLIRNVFGPAAVGQMIEHQINCLLGAKQYESFHLFLENKKQLIYEGSFKSAKNEIPATFNKDGSLTLGKTPRLPDEERKNLQGILDKELNELRNKLTKYLILYLKTEVFHNKQVYSQEVVVNEESGIISKLDLSNEDAICEIKNIQNHIDYYKYQLWYQQHSQQLDNTIAKTDKLRDLYTVVISQNEFDETYTDIYLLKIDFEIYDTPKEANEGSYWKRPKSYKYASKR